jgi:chromate reductase
MAKIGILVGSLRKDSYNKKLGEVVKSILQNTEDRPQVEILEIGNLPLYNQDLEENFPEVAQELKNKIESCDKLVFVTPEYNRSVPGVLKNAIDWASRPYGKNSISLKKVLCMGVSSGKLGTVSAQNELKKILVYLNCVVVGQPEIYIGPSAEMYSEEKKEFSEKTLEIVKKGLEVLIK